MHLCITSFVLVVQGTLTRTMIHRELTVSYKSEREEEVEERKRKANPVNCHHIHLIKATIDKEITDYETDTRMLHCMDYQ